MRFKPTFTAAIFGLSLFAVPLTAEAVPVQWTAAAGGNDHWYEFSTAALPWGSAVAVAQASICPAAICGADTQGYLVTLTSAAENAFVSTTVAGSVNFWIGANDIAIEAMWNWIDGPEAGLVIAPSGAGFASWSGGEPNNASNEDCAVGNWSGTNWNDLSCGGSFRYVIEYGPVAIAPPGLVPEPATLALFGLALAGLGLVRRRR